MKPFISGLLILLLYNTFSGKSQEQQFVPYTLADRAIRTEVKMEALETKMDTKFESVQKQID